MSPEEILRALRVITPEELHPTRNPEVFRSEWHQGSPAAKYCNLYTMWNGQPLAHPAVCLLGDDEGKILEEAIQRIEGHGKEETRPPNS